MDTTKIGFFSPPIAVSKRANRERTQVSADNLKERDRGIIRQCSNSSAVFNVNVKDHSRDILPPLNNFKPQKAIDALLSPVSQNQAAASPSFDQYQTLQPEGLALGLRKERAIGNFFNLGLKGCTDDSVDDK